MLPKTKKSDKVVRRFNINPYQGMAALIIGTAAEGLPLQCMVRKGNKGTAVYAKPIPVSLPL